MTSHRRSSGSSIIRILFGLIAIAFLGLIYWSSTLIETELKELRHEVRQLQGELSAIQVTGPSVPLASIRPHIRPDLPNLLKEDPYYTFTLPSLLPEGFRPKGTLRTAQTGRPQDLHPMTLWADARAIYDLCLGSLAHYHVGDYELYRSDLALKVEERETDEGPEYWIHLREGLSWEPLNAAHLPGTVTLSPYFYQRHPLTAYDFEFGYDAMMNPHVQEPLATAMRPYYVEIEEFRVVDELTFVVRWRSLETQRPDGSIMRRPKALALRTTLGLLPLPCWVYQRFANGAKIVQGDDYRSNSVWAQNFSQHWAKNVIVSCGPWLFDGMTDTEVRLRRNPRYHNRLAALMDRRVVYFKTGPDAIWQDFKAGKIDLFSSAASPQKLGELASFKESSVYLSQPHQIERIDYLQRSYLYVGWNQSKPIFASKRMRQALTLAIDRSRLIEQCLGSMGQETSGPFFPSDAVYAKKIEPYPFDPIAAQQLLREEGWADHDGDGVLDREVDGEVQKLRFRLLYFTHNPTSRLIVDGVATSLKEIGIECRPVGLDIADLSASFEGKDFDAIALGWSLKEPPPECRQLWHSEGALLKGSSNLVGFANSKADEIIEALDYEYDPAERRELYHQFHAVIHDQAPYTFLYVPKVALLYRDRVQNVFVPAQRPDLVPDGTVTEPLTSLFWLSEDD